MAMIDLTLQADLKALTAQTKRIADALHALLREAYGVHLEPLQADLSTAKDKGEVLYASDESTFKHDLMDARDGRDPFRPISSDEV